MIGAVVLGPMWWIHHQKCFGHVVASSVDPEMNGKHEVVIRELNNDWPFKSMNGYCRLEYYDDGILRSAVTWFPGDTFSVESASIRWVSRGNCECRVNGQIVYTLTPDGWRH